MRLAETEYAPEAETAPPLVVAHGLFGAAKNWRAHAKRFGAGRRVIAVDMRNHGESGWDARHDYPAMAEDLAETIEAAGGRAALLGHSMGGKAAMALAQTRPELIEKLIVADIAPVAYRHDLLDEIEAMRAVDLASMTRRSEVQDAIAARIDAPGVAAFLAHSARLGEAPGWALNLDALAENMPLITGYPDLDGVYDGPAFFLLGAKSDYVRVEHREKILRLFPNASHKALAGAGHWLHADKPREFLDAVNEFLSA